MDKMKICTGCKKSKDDSEYYVRKSGRVEVRCKTCMNLSSKKFRDGNEENKARKREYYKANSAKCIAKTSEWKKLNPERNRDLNRKSYQRNPSKSIIRAGVRQSNIEARTPSWANSFFLNEAYKLARIRSKLFGFKWHVDHIVPLKSKIVSGLHCEDNLAVVPAITNLKKSNKYWPDMPEENINGR